MLYKKDTKGRIRQLNIIQSGDTITQISGLIGGELVSHVKVCKGKNIGKSNETSPEEQAFKECVAKIEKKQQEGYFHTIERAKNEEIIMPMLAKTYEKEKHKIDWNGAVYAQPKLDGMRCLAFIQNGEVKLMSRKGVEITTMPHIVESLKEIKLDVILDGELYAHGKTFQENMSLIKKNREGSEEVVFHFYDLVDEESEYEERVEALFCISGPKYIERVRCFIIKDEEELFLYHDEFLSQGYEGTMVRHGRDGYKVNGRSSQLLKVKDFIDETYTITNVIPMEVYPNQGLIICKLADDKYFRATPKMTHTEREELLTNKEDFIGKTAEVRFFEYTDDGFPRFPIFYGIRLDK